MTITKAKLLWAAGMFLAAWLFREKKGPEATGTVDLGVPTVDGIFDGVYWSKRGAVAAPDAPTSSDPTMRQLIDESNAAIAAAGGPDE